MKIDSNPSRFSFDSKNFNNKGIEKPDIIHYVDKSVNNTFLSLSDKELNYNIGLLQSANLVINNILTDSNISLEDVISIIKNASFMGKNIFSKDTIIKYEDQMLFDANHVLDIIPVDNKDIYLFKKSLREVQKSLLSTIEEIKQKVSVNKIVNKIDVDYLTSNSKLFSNSHNTDGLASKIDMLLA